MFTPISLVEISQVSTSNYPGRSKVFSFNFLNECSISSTWAHLTDTCRIVLPRRIYFLDGQNKTTWDNEQIYGNPTKAPLILRGDKIKVTLGYSYYKPVSNTDFNREIISETYTYFEGYITKISNKTPIVFECEDNMYALKQTRVQDKEWKDSAYTLEAMLKDIINKSTFSDTKTFTIKTDNFKHKIGIFRTMGVQAAQVLDELRKNYHLESFFREKELRCGIIRYYPEDREDHMFHFQKNIISDSLDYQRADDVRIGIKAFSISKQELGSNSSGGRKTKKQRLETTVGDTDGEIRTLYFTEIDSVDELKKQAEKKLPFLRYQGFRGSFVTFGLPKVKHGDACILIDDVLPERNGTYLVKEVKYTCGMDGLRQEIFLDIRIDGLEPNQLTEFQKNGA